MTTSEIRHNISQIEQIFYRFMSAPTDSKKEAEYIRELTKYENALLALAEDRITDAWNNPTNYIFISKPI